MIGWFDGLNDLNPTQSGRSLDGVKRNPGQLDPGYARASSGLPDCLGNDQAHDRPFHFHQLISSTTDNRRANKNAFAKE